MNLFQWDYFFGRKGYNENLFFQFFKTRKENYIHLHCIGVTAEISETDDLKHQQVKSNSIA